MEYMKLGVFALFVIGGTWMLGRLMSRCGRNHGDLHGGGVEGMVDEL